MESARCFHCREGKSVWTDSPSRISPSCTVAPRRARVDTEARRELSPAHCSILKHRARICSFHPSFLPSPLSVLSSFTFSSRPPGRIHDPSACFVPFVPLSSPHSPLPIGADGETLKVDGTCKRRQGRPLERGRRSRSVDTTPGRSGAVKQRHR